MANNYQQVPFWDFIRAFDANGAGVDHPAEGESPEGHPFTFPPGYNPHHHPHHGAFAFSGPGFAPGAGFGGFAYDGPWGPRGGFGSWGRGGRGHHCRRERSGDEAEPARGSRPSSPNGERSEGEAREEGTRGPRGFGRHGRGNHHRGWGHHGRRGPPPPFAGPGGMGAFDMRPLFDALNSHPIGQHPWAQALRNLAEQAGVAGNAQQSGETLVPEGVDAENSFIPPIDVFSTETAYVLHIALPGAKKEDVGVNWDADKGVLNLAGVVYRQGDEEFLKTLSQSERKVGVFERTVKLPPGSEEKEEVDGDAITAKLEDGVLIVTVPKVEKEWTEVKRVDVN